MQESANLHRLEDRKREVKGLVSKLWKVSKGPGKGMGTQTTTTTITTATQGGSRAGREAVRANINRNSTLSWAASSDIRGRSCGSSCVRGVVAVMVIVVIWEWRNGNGSKNGDSKTAEQHNRRKANVINLFP